MERRNNKNTNNNIKKFPSQKNRKKTKAKSSKINSTSYTYENNLRNINNQYSSQNNYYSYENNRLENTNLARAKNSKKTRKTKKRNNILFGRLFTFFIFLIAISYFSISIIKSLNKNPIQFKTINYGTIDNQKTAKGIIIRDESVYKANKNGSLSFFKSEYEKIRNGELIASIKDKEATKDTEAEIDEINKKILQLQENRTELSLFSEDVKKINLQIENVLENGIYELAKNDISSIYSLKNTVEKKINIRNSMLLSESNGSISQLAEQKKSKEQQINANIQNIFANTSGILCYNTDGLEEKFTFQNLNKITPEETKMNSEIQNQIDEYKIQVLENEPIFKIVKNNTFYIATNIKTEYIVNWKKGDLKTIYILDNGNYIPQEVLIEKIELDKKDAFILMKATKNILEYIDKRSVTFEINKPKEGFKIDTKAIAEKNLLKIPSEYIEDNTIIKKDESGSKKIIIQNTEINELEKITYVPIEFGKLSTGDTIIHPKTKAEFIIKDVYTAKGLYIVNSGIYEFKKINLQNSVSNEDFTILDPSFNKNIKIYDRFVPDPKNILKEELIYN